MKLFLKVQIVKLVVHFAILWWLMRNEANKLTKKRYLSLLPYRYTKMMLSSSSVDNVNISLFTLFILSIFDSYWPQAQWILLNNPRDEVESEANSCFSINANNCFGIIARVLSNSVVNSFCFWNHFFKIVLSSCIEISSQFPPEFNKFIQSNQQILHGKNAFFWKVLA